MRNELSVGQLKKILIAIEKLKKEEDNELAKNFLLCKAAFENEKVEDWPLHKMLENAAFITKSFEQIIHQIDKKVPIPTFFFLGGRFFKLQTDFENQTAGQLVSFFEFKKKPFENLDKIIANYIVPVFGTVDFMKKCDYVNKYMSANFAAKILFFLFTKTKSFGVASVIFWAVACSLGLANVGAFSSLSTLY